LFPGRLATGEREKPRKKAREKQDKRKKEPKKENRTKRVLEVIKLRLL